MSLKECILLLIASARAYALIRTVYARHVRVCVEIVSLRFRDKTMDGHVSFPAVWATVTRQGEALEPGLGRKGSAVHTRHVQRHMGASTWVKMVQKSVKIRSRQRWTRGPVEACMRVSRSTSWQTRRPAPGRFHVPSLCVLWLHVDSRSRWVYATKLALRL